MALYPPRFLYLTTPMKYYVVMLCLTAFAHHACLDQLDKAFKASLYSLKSVILTIDQL